MFVSAEDFNVRPYKLPNLDDATVLEEFEAFVNSWEEDVEKGWPFILGRSFYNKFVEEEALLPDEWDAEVDYLIGDEVVIGLDIYGAVADNTDSEPDALNADWLLLEEGNRWLKLLKGYEYTIEAGPTYKWIGLIKAEKFAVFSKWLSASVNNVSGAAGSVNSTVENSETINSAQDISSAWNKFARLIGGRTKSDKCDTLYGYLHSFSNVDIFDDTFDETFHDFGGYLVQEFGYPGRLNQFNI